MRHVLVADDHEVTRRGVSEIVREAFDGVQIHEAQDSASVAALLDACKWDLILLDVMMPGEDVMTTLGRIRAVDPGVPILILTAALELEYVIQTMKAGANGLIHKHRAADELLDAIRRVANGGTYLHADTAAAIATSLRQERTPLPHEQLSEREMEVFCLIALGKAVKEIAWDLGLSDKTVATYLARIREKTGLTTHVEIARYALQNRLVE